MAERVDRQYTAALAVLDGRRGLPETVSRPESASRRPSGRRLAEAI